MRGVKKLRYGWRTEFLKIEFRYHSWAQHLTNDDYNVYMRSAYALVRINTTYQRDAENNVVERNGARVRIPVAGSVYADVLQQLQCTHGLIEATPIDEYRTRMPMRQRSVQRMSDATRANAARRRVTRESMQRVLSGDLTGLRVEPSQISHTGSDAAMTSFLAGGQ